MPRSAGDIVADLRALLAAAGVHPPHVLVGIATVKTDMAMAMATTTAIAMTGLITAIIPTTGRITTGTATSDPETQAADAGTD